MSKILCGSIMKVEPQQLLFTLGKHRIALSWPALSNTFPSCIPEEFHYHNNLIHIDINLLYTPFTLSWHRTLHYTPYAIDLSWGFWYCTMSFYVLESANLHCFNECCRTVQVPCPYLVPLSEVFQIYVCTNSTWTRYSRFCVHTNEWILCLTR